eukprot:scaffold123896_cov69-Phaeocystis_antarctica.AAC.3
MLPQPPRSSAMGCEHPEAAATTASVILLPGWLPPLPRLEATPAAAEPIRSAIPTLPPPSRLIFADLGSFGPVFWGRVPTRLTQLPGPSSVVTTKAWLLTSHLKTCCVPAVRPAPRSAISRESAVESIRRAFGCFDAPRPICEAPPIGMAAPATKAATSSCSMPRPRRDDASREVPSKNALEGTEVREPRKMCMHMSCAYPRVVSQVRAVLA